MAERADPASRGRLTIADRVVERVATRAAGEVGQVVSTGSGLDNVLGHRYPRADATVAGDRARIQVQVAVAWPAPLAQVCASVRDHVRTRVGDLVGVQVDAVDVTAAKVVPAPAPERRSVQ